GRPLKSQMVSQGAARVLGAKSSSALQDWHDVVDKRRQLVGECRSHNGESVDGTCVLPTDHVIGKLLRRPDEVTLTRAPAHPLGNLTQRRVGLCPGGREELICPSRRRLLGPEM